MKTAILSWLQNDGTRGFSKNQLKGKQLSLTFRPDVLVVFRAEVYMYSEQCMHWSSTVCYNVIKINIVPEQSSHYDPYITDKLTN